MDENKYEVLIKDIREVAHTINGVKGTEKRYVRKSGLYFLVDLHLIVDGQISVREGHEIAHAVKSEIVARFSQIEHVLIHVEPKS